MDWLEGRQDEIEEQLAPPLPQGCCSSRITAAGPLYRIICFPLGGWRGLAVVVYIPADQYKRRSYKQHSGADQHGRDGPDAIDG